jgi:hypothetical protein
MILSLESFANDQHIRVAHINMPFETLACFILLVTSVSELVVSEHRRTVRALMTIDTMCCITMSSLRLLDYRRWNETDVNKLCVRKLFDERVLYLRYLYPLLFPPPHSSRSFPSTLESHLQILWI